MLIPTNYEQFVEVRRQQEAKRQQERSPEYERLLADTQDSVAEWSGWRVAHPGPGTMMRLRASAKWLNPIMATAGSPLLVSAPWLLVSGWIVYQAAKYAIPRIEARFADRAVRRIRQDGIKGHN